MIDIIYLAASGLQGYERGLRVIANNTANLNTPGFKGGAIQFADTYATGGGADGSQQIGLGLSTLGTVLSFQQGQMQNTGNTLDLAVDGQGFFMLRDRDGNISYTRDGQFSFNEDGILVKTGTEEQVLARDASGALAPVNISALRLQAGQVTSTVTFNGTLSTGATDPVRLENVTVIDPAGGSHTLTVVLEHVEGTPGTWNFRVRDGNGDLTLGRGGQMVFLPNGQVDTANLEAFQPQAQWVVNGQTVTLTFDFATNVQTYNQGPSSTIAMASQNGYAPGTMTAASFDANGQLVLTYSNGQTVRRERLALARFSSPDMAKPVGGNRFEAVDQRGWIQGVANHDGFGIIRSAVLEMSNVDLSSEFSDLVIMQRGYQASSQVVSTANEMLNDLFAMKGK